ncbi:MAG: hypothetical protein ACFE7E_08940, partial [Candidatus Hodarchaeota archaeon]
MELATAIPKSLWQWALTGTLKEELIMNGRITIAVDKNKQVNAIQKGGAGPLPYEDVLGAVEIAVRKAKELLDKLPK